MGRHDPQEVLSHLWTPFGKVNFLGGGSTMSLVNVTQHFINQMKGLWSLDEVSDSVTAFQYWNVEGKITTRGPFSFATIREAEKYRRSRLYLIKNIGGSAFVDSHQPLKPLKIFCTCYIDVESYNQDYKALFAKLSGGTNKF